MLQILLFYYITSYSEHIPNECICDQQRDLVSAYSRLRAQRAHGRLCQQLLVHQAPLCNSTASCQHGAGAHYSSAGARRSTTSFTARLHLQLTLVQAAAASWGLHRRLKLNTPQLYCQQPLQLHLKLKASLSKPLPKFRSRI